jgi:hypothetical protein
MAYGRGWIEHVHRDQPRGVASFQPTRLDQAVGKAVAEDNTVDEINVR